MDGEPPFLSVSLWPLQYIGFLLLPNYSPFQKQAVERPEHQKQTGVLGTNKYIKRKQCIDAELTTRPQIYPHWTPNPDITPETAAAAVSLDFLEGDDRTMTEDLMRDWVARRVRHMYGHPHIRKCKK